jgi:hypothetical protein
MSSNNGHSSAPGLMSSQAGVLSQLGIPKQRLIAIGAPPPGATAFLRTQTLSYSTNTAVCRLSLDWLVPLVLVIQPRASPSENTSSWSCCYSMTWHCDGPMESIASRSCFIVVWCHCCHGDAFIAHCLSMCLTFQQICHNMYPITQQGVTIIVSG